MTQTHLMTVVATPLPQPRQRTRVMTSKAGQAIAQNYTPARGPVAKYKQLIASYTAQQFQTPLTCPLAIDVQFVMPRPKRLVWARRPMPRLWHQTKPDIDNLLKAVFDAMAGIAYLDDKQITIISACKQVASGNEVPHVRINIREIETP